MAEKNIKSRIIHKHDVEAHWNLAENFIPKQGEIIVYDVDENYTYERFKIGDGITLVSNLPFANTSTVGKNGEGEFSEIFNDYENNSALGDYSHAEGEKTSGFSRNAHAEGGQVKSGGRGFKIIDCTNEGNGNGYYIINTTELGGLVVGDRYSVRMASAKYDVGAITNIEALTDGTTKLTVNNYPNIALEAEDANDPASYTVENYLTIVGKPHLGNVDVGFNAHAEGEKTIAQDRDAHAEGRGAKAIGQYAHAEGRDTVATYAAHAEGRGTKAMGNMAHAEGQNTKALGERTHAEGATTEAIGNNSHAEGQNTKAIGHTSHAEGWNTMAMADVTHAEGVETKAYGYASHSEGNKTEAFGITSHTEGTETSAFSRNAHGEGGQTKAGGKGFKIIECAGPDTDGNGTYIVSGADIAGIEIGVDRYSVRLSTAVYDVGVILNAQIKENGTTEFTVSNYPNIPIETEDITDPENFSVENYMTIVGKPHVGIIDIGFNAHSEGEGSIAQDRDAHAEGRSTKAIGQYGHSEGRDTVAAYASHAEGQQSQAIGDLSHAEGYATKTSGTASHAEGSGAQAIGSAAHAEGQDTIAEGYSAHAEGIGSKAQGTGSHAAGLNTIAKGDYQTTIGKFNVEDPTAAFIIGNGNNNSERDNALMVDWNGDMTLAGRVIPSDYTNLDERYLKNVGDIGAIMNYCGELNDVAQLPETADDGDIYIINKKSIKNGILYTGKLKDLIHCATEEELGIFVTGNPDTLLAHYIKLNFIPEEYTLVDTNHDVDFWGGTWCAVYNSTTGKFLKLLSVGESDGYPQTIVVEEGFGVTSIEDEITLCLGLRINPDDFSYNSNYGFVDQVEIKTLKSTYCWTEGSWALINSAFYDELNEAVKQIENTIDDVREDVTYIENRIENKVEDGGFLCGTVDETVGAIYTTHTLTPTDNSVKYMAFMGKFSDLFEFYYDDPYIEHPLYLTKLSNVDYPEYFTTNQRTYIYNADDGKFLGEFAYDLPAGASVEGLCGYNGNDDDIVSFVITNAGSNVEFNISPIDGIYFSKEGQTIRLKTELDKDIETGLPEVTMDDNGKFLRVVEGEWTADEVEIGEGGIIAVSQEFGDSKTKTMSQDVITNTFESLGNIVCGKNLFDFSKGQAGVRFDDNGNIISAGATNGITDYIPIKSGDCIAISRKDETGTRVNFDARRILGYDKDKNFIGLLRTYTYAFSFFAEDLAYIRIHFGGSFSEENEIQIEAGGTKSEYKPYEEALIPNEESIFRTTENIQIPLNRTTSDLTIIGDRICVFVTGSEVGTMDGAIYSARINEIDKTMPVLNTRIYHDFGHCNTIDYNEKTDCLILGNGSGEYGVDGKFYIIPEAHKILERNQNALAEIAIEYDCTAYNFGDKVNVCWGYDNNGKHDIAIMITDDNKNIRFIQLGKGANALEYGSLIADKADNEFNGTFKVQAEYTIDDDTRFGDSINCNQGSCYRDGILYVAIGHEPHRHWEIAFRPDGKASYTEVYEPIYGDDGIAVTGATEGMTVTDNYIITSEVIKYSEDNNVRNLVFRKRNQSQILSMSIIDSKDIKHENETLLNIINELQNKISALETAIGSIDTALTSILTMQDELIGGDISMDLDEVLEEQDELIGGDEA